MDTIHHSGGRRKQHDAGIVAIPAESGTIGSGVSAAAVGFFE